MKAEPKPKYVWVSAEKPPVIITDLAAVFKHSAYRADYDQIFELGREVKIKIDIVAIPSGPVKRDYSWENKE